MRKRVCLNVCKNALPPAQLALDDGMATIGDEGVNPTGGGLAALAIIGGTRECVVHDSAHRVTGRLGRIPNETLWGVNEGGGRVVVGVVRAVLSDPAPVMPGKQPRRNRGVRCSRFC